MNGALEEKLDAAGQDEEVVTAHRGRPKAAKRKAKKNKPSAASDKKEQTRQQKQELAHMSMDEFSALLASQATLNNEAGQGPKGTVTATVTPLGPLSDVRSHLCLSAQALDPAVELKKQFGAAAIKAYEAEAAASSSGPSPASSTARARAQAWNPNFKTRNILVQPKETWPPIARTFTGMTMEVMDVEGRGKMGGWVHSRCVGCVGCV